MARTGLHLQRSAVAIAALGSLASCGSGTSKPAPAGPAAQDALRARLLTAADLGPGWEAAEDDSQSSSKVISGGCRNKRSTVPSSDPAVFRYFNGRNEYADEELVRYPTKTAARDDLAATAAFYASCSTIKRFDQPSLISRSSIQGLAAFTAFTIQSTVNGRPVTTDLIMRALGTDELLVTHSFTVGSATLTTVALADLAEKALTSEA